MFLDHFLSKKEVFQIAKILIESGEEQLAMKMVGAYQKEEQANELAKNGECDSPETKEKKNDGGEKPSV